jgi:hypothetical protein
MACATALAALALVGAGDTAVAVGVRLAAVSLVSLVAALVRGWSSFIPVSLVFLGAAYAIHLGVDNASLDVKAPLFGAGLFLTAELAYWSLEERDRIRGEPGDALRRLGVVAILVLVALGSGGVLLAAADLTRTRGLAIDLIGAAAAAAALFVVVMIARRPRADSA